MARDTRASTPTPSLPPPHTLLQRWSEPPLCLSRNEHGGCGRPMFSHSSPNYPSFPLVAWQYGPARRAFEKNSLVPAAIMSYTEPRSLIVRFIIRWRSGAILSFVSRDPARWFHYSRSVLSSRMPFSSFPISVTRTTFCARSQRTHRVPAVKRTRTTHYGCSTSNHAFVNAYTYHTLSAS